MKMGLTKLLINNLYSWTSLVVLFFLVFSASQQEVLAVKKAYVVYLGGHSHGPKVTTNDLHRVTTSHHDLLASYLGSKESAEEAILYSYTRHINGFAAYLEEEDAENIAKHPDVVSVFPNRGIRLHTSHSWSFLMVEKEDGGVQPKSIWKKAKYGKDVIIANLDCGVWPESPSFTDHGLGPIPSKWKGSCENASVPCNRKLIGAKYFNKGYLAYLKSKKLKMRPKFNTARDHDGHGSHTLSTAGGNFVHNATVVNFNAGTVKGGSPGARVAAYKVCWLSGGSTSCWDGDILAGFDAAIHDGVDVISLSVGGPPGSYFDDSIAIGAFHAARNNIVVVASAGNDGPRAGSVTNVSPWLITVAASTMDRRFQAAVELPTGLLIKGASLSKSFSKKKFYPIIYAGEAKAANSSFKDAELCFPGTLDRKKVQGKILVCLRGVSDRVDKGHQAVLAGAVGMILCNDVVSGNDIEADPHFLPATQITYNDSLSLYAYMNSTKDPKAYIQPTQGVLHVKPAPTVAPFSSRGPNSITSDILKPDIIAPGVDIIAAYSEEVSPTTEVYDKRRSSFQVLSGTSMSCPHVAGVVGLLKVLHPDWSPAAIRSAIMTTARTRDNTVNPMLDGADLEKATPFGYGAGHLRPNRAMDPGLVYDITVKDHLDFLCGIGYNQTSIRLVAGQNYECPKGFSINDYNYPSISVTNLKTKKAVTVSRKLKNVGSPGTYAARLRNPVGVSLSVEPRVLTFDRIGEEKSFKLTIEAAENHNHEAGSHEFGELLWSDGQHYVRSPIVVAFPTKKKKNNDDEDELPFGSTN